MPGSKKKGSQPSTRTVMRKIETTIQNPSTEPRHTRPRADGARSPISQPRAQRTHLRNRLMGGRPGGEGMISSRVAQFLRRRWRARPIKDAVMTGPTLANGGQEAEGIWENAEHASHEARSAATCSPMRDCQGQRSKHTPLCSRSIRACTRTIQICPASDPHTGLSEETSVPSSVARALRVPASSANLVIYKSPGQRRAHMGRRRSYEDRRSASCKRCALSPGREDGGVCFGGEDDVARGGHEASRAACRGGRLQSPAPVVEDYRCATYPAQPIG
ncbi:hypothetical protein B0H19DRAFT_1060301 [Mycena capillaripes]|nr:hypothetical protein B0H19DRAFT_1060301 [Mycena capillaripes]